MNTEPLVSIVIPTYKRPEMLERAILSVLRQTYANIEIIVVNDNDVNTKYYKDTYEIMKKFKGNNKIKYTEHGKNLGGSTSRNTGIQCAQGKFVSFLDDDDEYYPGKIEKQVKKFYQSELENLGFVYCQMELFNENNELIQKTKNFYRGNRVPFKENMTKCIAGTPTILALKKVLLKVGGFKKVKSGQDWYLILEILEKGYNVDFLEDILVRVNIHEGERISNSLSKVKSLDNEILEIKKKYLKKFPDDYAKVILHEHYLQLANHIKLFNKKESISYFYKALQHKVISIRNIKFIGSLFVNKRIRDILKRNLYKK